MRISIIVLLIAMFFQFKAQAFHSTFNRMPADTTWPGDANGDGKVDESDILYIGIAWGAKGPVRNSISNVFKADTCRNWSKSFRNGVNYNTANCDGDTIVGLSDTLAVYNNFGLTHTGGKQVDTTYTGKRPDLIMTVSPDTVKAKDTVHITVVTGSKSHPVDSIYGVSFELTMDTTYINKSKTGGVNFNTSWLGTSKLIKITLAKDELKTQGLMAVACTRNDHTNSNGYDTLCVMDIVIVDNLSGGVAKINPRLKNVVGLTAHEYHLRFKVQDSATIVVTGTKEVLPMQKPLKVQRLDNGQVRLVSDYTIVSTEIVDMLGQTVERIRPNQPVVTLSPKGLAAGVYAVVLTFEDGSRVTKPLVINAK